MAVRSPARDCRASINASRRSVFMRCSLGLRVMREGAMTSQLPVLLAQVCTQPYPHGPASYTSSGVLGSATLTSQRFTQFRRHAD